MRDFYTLGLPPGYHLDLVGDPCVISLCRPDGTIVARFTHTTDPKQIWRTAEEDVARQAPGSIV